MERLTRTWFFIITAMLLCCGGEATTPMPDADARPISDDARADAFLGAPAVAIDATENMTCVVRDGEVWCWGGLPGCDPSLASGLPRRVAGLTDVEQVAVGTELGCAVMSGGTVSCWAFESDAEPSEEEQEDGPWEVFLVAGIANTVKLAAGEDVCALGDDGKVRCWTLGASGLLGPDHVDLPWAMVDIAVGPWFACSVGANGKVHCWDAGKWESSPQENNYAVATSQIDLATTAVLMAVTSSGWCVAGESPEVECWTDQPDGPDGVFIKVPTGAPEGAIVALVADNETFCARYANGEVLCWLESLGPSKAWSPIDATITSWATGATHFCGTQPDGDTFCLGENRAGQLGQGAPADALTVTETDLTLSTDTISLSTGEGVSCQIEAKGLLTCWGGDDAVQPEGTSLPPCPEDGAIWAEVSSAGSGYALGAQVCALSDTGAVWCMDYGATDSSSAAWRAIPLTGDVHAIAADNDGRGCALMVEAPPLCWHRLDSIRVEEITSAGGPFNALSCFHGRCCAIGFESGTVCFNNISAGEEATLEMIAFPDLQGNQVTIGEDASCALDSSGTVRCWGFNGRCGVGSDTLLPTVSSPVAVSLSAPAVGLAAGRLFHCAQTADGTLHCWGQLDATCHLDLGAKANGCAPGSYPGLDVSAHFLVGAASHILMATPGQNLHYLGRNESGEVPGAPVPRSDGPLVVGF
jgi:alpha-tubulin suppressor-like RCC1 family protein